MKNILYILITVCWTVSAFAAPFEYTEPRLKGMFFIENEDGSLTNQYFGGNNPAIGQDGTIYIDAYRDGFFAINPDGSIKWHIDNVYTPVYYFSFNMPAIGQDGMIYVCNDSSLTAISQEGTIAWNVPLDAKAEDSPAVGADGTIYVGNNDGYLYAIASNGVVKWKYHFNKFFTTSPAIGPDGTVYIGCYDGYLYAIYPWGALRWKAGRKTYIYEESPAVAPDGTILFTDSSTLYAVNPDGTDKWEYNGANGNPVISTDGTIYIGDSHMQGALLAINADGSLKWRYDVAGGVTYSAIGNNGIIYTATGLNQLLAIDTEGMLRWSYQLTEYCKHPVISPDGVLYIVASSLYAFQTDSYGYEADAPWPNFMANNTRCITDPDYEFPPLHTVSGAIVLPDSTPLAGVQVSIDSLITETGENGYFSFELPDGEYAIDILTGNQFIPRRVYVTVQGEDVIANLSQAEWYTVAGRLMQHGQPLTGVTVHAGDINATSGSDGRFSLHLSEGNHTLEFDRENGGYFPSLKDINVSGRDQELDIDLYPIRLVYNGTQTLREGFFWSGDAPCIMDTQQGSTIIKRFEENKFVYVYKFDESLDRFPVTGAEGYLFRSRENLTLLNPDFTLAWNNSIATNSSAIGGGNVYYGIQGNLVALNTDEKYLWKNELLTDGSLNLTCASDGTLYVIAYPGMLYACNPADGTIKWTFPVQNESLTYLFLSPDDKILLKASRYFYLLNPDGSLSWKYYIGEPTWFSPAFGPDGMVLINTDDGELIAIAEDGEILWTYAALPEFQEPVYSAATGEFWCRNEYTYGLDPVDGSIKWKDPIDFYDAACSPDGDMYIVDYLSYEQRKIYHIDINPDPPVSVDGPEADQESTAREHPTSLRLHPNYPNPFNPSTTIAFSLPEDGDVRLAVYNISGQLMGEIVARQLPAGQHEFVWDGRDDNGAQAGSGIYFARLTAGGKRAVRRMALVR